MNPMKSILLAALFALPLPLAAQTPTAESFTSAAKLKELCAADTADNPVSSTFVCVGYIMGVVDTLASLKAWDQAECLLALPRDLGTIAMTETVKATCGDRTTRSSPSDAPNVVASKTLIMRSYFSWALLGSYFSSAFLGSLMPH